MTTATAVGERTVATSDGVDLRLRRFAPRKEHSEPRSFLLVHGLSSNALLWDGIGDLLAGHGHHAVAVDLRSHGRSGSSDDVGLGRVVDDLAEVIAAEELGHPIVVGQSWGGNVAVELARTRPSEVAGVVGVDGGLIALAERFDSFAACWDVLAPPDLAHVRWDDVVARLRTRTHGWPGGALEAQLANLTRLPSGGVRPVLGRDRHRRILEDLYVHPGPHRVEDVRVPVLMLVVTGGRATVVDLHRCRELARRREAFDVVELPGRDHDVHLQDPGLVTQLILDWSEGRSLPEVA